MILNLCLRPLLVPLRGLEKFFLDLVLQVGNSFVQFGEGLPGDGLRGFTQDLLDTSEIFPELRKGFGERFVGGGADPVLLQRQGGVNHRAPPCEAVDCLLRLSNMRLDQALNLLVELLHRFVGGFFEGGFYARVDLLDERFRVPMQFVAALTLRLVELRLKSCKGLLLRVLKFGGMLFDALMGFCGAREDRFQLLRLFLHGFAHGRQALFPFGSHCPSGFLKSGAVPRGFFLKLREQRA